MMAPRMTGPLLSVERLSVEFTRDGRVRRPVAGISYHLEPGRTLGVVGESGSGKSLTALALIGLVPAPGLVSGSIRFAGQELVGADPATLRQLRGDRIAMVFQEPMTALNPVMNVGRQIAEVLVLHQDLGWQAARERAVELLDAVGIPSPRERARSFPHQLSGGMRQRAMIAMALACRPALLIADEPTTALDVTIQAQILDLMLSLQAEIGMAIQFISHNLAVISEVADEIIVIYAGRVVEQAPADALLDRPTPSLYAGTDRNAARSRPSGRPAAGDPGRRAGSRQWRPRLPLRAALPACRRGLPRRRAAAQAGRCRPPRRLLQGRLMSLIELAGVSAHFPVSGGSWLARRQILRAVEAVSFAIGEGETLALVGESGSGKTTLGQMVAGLRAPTEGRLSFRGQPMSSIAARRGVQIVFQDPFSALDPRMPVSSLIAEPLAIQRIGTTTERRARAARLVEQVGLPRDALNRYPHEFSGGQRQRIAIARALAPDPALIVADEPLSALDVSIQSQILNLLKSIQEERRLSYLFISHDLGVVNHLADRVAVLYLGRLVELAERADFFARPSHPYSQALLRSVPRVGRGRRRPGSALTGEMPSALKPPSGCAFHPRCPKAQAICKSERPELAPAPGRPLHLAACHFKE